MITTRTLDAITILDLHGPLVNGSADAARGTATTTDDVRVAFGE